MVFIQNGVFTKDAQSHIEEWLIDLGNMKIPSKESDSLLDFLERFYELYMESYNNKALLSLDAATLILEDAIVEILENKENNINLSILDSNIALLEDDIMPKAIFNRLPFIEQLSSNDQIILKNNFINFCNAIKHAIEHAINKSNDLRIKYTIIRNSKDNIKNAKDLSNYIEKSKIEFNSISKKQDDLKKNLSSLRKVAADLEGFFNKVEKEIKNLKVDYIAILGLFSTIVLAFVGGLTLTSITLSNISIVPIPKIVFVIGCLTISILLIFWMLIYFIALIKDNLQPKNKWRLPIIIISISIIALVVFSIFNKTIIFN